MTAQELRKKYLDFFESKGHAIIPSASLVPEGTDPTVLFNTAGMQQFKAYYLNPDEAKEVRIATIQKCIRTGDIDEVGDDTHLTFFEMLGNFSFGYPGKENSYFKKETLQYAWEFLIEVLKIDKSRIYATYFKGENGVSEDTESLEILKTINELKDIRQQGFADNFWSLGTENSPGGPTVEFYVDGVEVWNCVFNEYFFRNGKYEKSENKGVDTGMGLERLLMVMEGKNNVYETDLFQLIFEKIEKIYSTNYKLQTKNYRIIADHIKAAAFIISDGVIPSNVQRGSVLRRLIRDAFEIGKQIGIENNFTTQVAEVVIEMYKDFYKELESNKNKIFEELEKEENTFSGLLKKKTEIKDKQLKLFYDLIYRESALKSGKSEQEIKELLSKGEISVPVSGVNFSAEAVFNLETTHGYPRSLFFKDLEKKISDTDIMKIKKEVDKKMKKHQELSRTASAGMFKGGLADSGEETAKLHTATHLLLAALRETLSPKIYQKGSNITAERLRLDFNYSQKLTPEQLKQIEDLVNAKIQENIPVEMTEMPKDEALKVAKVSFDPTKYGDVVKVYKIGEFSIELCGGPHAKSTGELGYFRIKKEEASSAGVRRIKAVLE